MFKSLLDIPARRPLLFAALSVALLALSGCADTADTFPLNDQARAIGPLHVDFTRTGLGFAPVTATLGDGEVLRGHGSPGFRWHLQRGLRVWAAWDLQRYGIRHGRRRGAIRRCSRVRSPASVSRVCQPRRARQRGVSYLR